MRQGQPQNRQRSRGRGNNRNNNNRNNLNRSMESNGPDVRIRGTASHIAEKYAQLAHDAQTSGDTVAAQAYWQHAEHYNRILAAAQAQQAEEQARRDEERARRQEEHEKRQEARQQNRDDDGDEDESDDDDDRNRGRSRKGRRPRNDERGDQPRGANGASHEDDKPAAASKKTDQANSPQPDIEGEPAEVSLKDKPVENGADKPKAKRGRPKKKPEPVAEDAADLPAFVTGE